MPHATPSNTVFSPSRPPETLWSLRREASLNWLALGLLLAAWNASDNEVAPAAHPATHSARRPEALGGYSYVSVRALNRVTLAR